LSKEVYRNFTEDRGAYFVAIFVEGMKCAVCNKPVFADNTFIMFSNIIPNKLDPLWIFNDAIVHSECFTKHKLYQSMQERIEEHDRMNTVKNRVCNICNNVITDPDNYISIGHLTEDKTHPLYKFNYSRYHVTCLKEWANIEYFRNSLIELQNSGQWSGESLSLIIQKINRCIQ
jgi:hypothetical protein